MKPEQSKTLIINILTAVVVLGVLIVGYTVFIKKGTETPVVPVAQIVEETNLIGSEVDATVRDLGKLERSVASAVAIFEMPAFKNLQNYSAVVPEEPVSRVNPFIPTQWKIKMKALEASAMKQSVASQVQASTNPSTTQPATTPTPATPADTTQSQGI